MSGRSVGGALAMILGLALAVGGVFFAFGSNPPDLGLGVASEDLGNALLALGGLGVVVGLVLLIVPRKSPKVLAPAPVKAPAQRVEIKRTDMSMAGAATPDPVQQLQDALDAVNQKLSRAKVQFGMGQISGETYQRLQQEYGAERAALEQKIFESGNQ